MTCFTKIFYIWRLTLGSRRNENSGLDDSQGHGNWSLDLFLCGSCGPFYEEPCLLLVVPLASVEQRDQILLTRGC